MRDKNTHSCWGHGHAHGQGVMSRRDFLKKSAIVGASLAGVSLAGCVGSKSKPAAQAAPKREETDKIRIGWIPLGCISPYFIARTNGYWEDQGLEVEYFKFTSGPPMLEAWASGRLDVSYVGVTVVAAGASKGLPITLIAGDHWDGMSIVGKGMESIDDMKGKTIGTTPLGAIPDVNFRGTILRHGLEIDKDLKVVVMGFPDLNAALASGAVDGFASCESYPAYAIEKIPGTKTVASLRDNTLWPGKGTQCCGPAARNAFIENNPEATEKFLKGHLKAVKFILNDKDAAAGIIAKALGTSPSAERLSLDHCDVRPDVSVKTTQNYADAMANELGIIKKVPEMSEHINNDLWKDIWKA